MNKIEELTKQLIAELEAQGHNVVENNDVSHFDVWVYKGRLSVQKVGAWEIECGEVAV